MSDFLDTINGWLHPAAPTPAATITDIAPDPVADTAVDAVALPGDPIITVAILTMLGGHDPEDWAPILDKACRSHGIDTPLRVAAWLANVLNETGNLTTLSENLNYSAAALLAQWPSHFTADSANADGRTASHSANQQAIADAAYDNRMGNGGGNDGWIFRGSGGLQTTGRANFEALGKAIGWTRPIEELPAYVQTRDGAATSAAIYWEANPALNAAADRGDIATVRRIVNGGLIGLPAVQVHYAAALRAFGISATGV